METRHGELVLNRIREQVRRLRRLFKPWRMSEPITPIEGGLYMTKSKSESGFRLLKVLRFEDGIVHVRIFKNKFQDRPTQIDPSMLTLGTVDDEEGFGIGHLPLKLEVFLSWKAQFLQHSVVEPNELDGYEMWKESKGGAWG